MNIAVRTTPPIGATIPGDLYADLQSRTLWLGVDPAVDPAQAVLVSDIVALMDNDDQVLADAKAYTDTQITTRAPTVHTHTASQVTDFTSAVTSVVAGIPGFNWVHGMVMMWSGSLAEIGVGDLAGWVLCDGTSGSPDLRDRFVIGAGNKAVGSKNTPTTLSTSDNGALTLTVNPTSLTIAQLPAHSHTVSVSGSGSGSTNAAGLHNHNNGGYNQLLTVNGTGTIRDADNSSVEPYLLSSGTILDAGSHSHTVSVSVSASGTTASQGSDGAHTHTIPPVAAHHHDLTPLQIRETVPYFALAYIFKL